jgi:alpha-glucosidase
VGIERFLVGSLPKGDDDRRRGYKGYLGRPPPHAWPDWVIGSHNKPRIASRVGRVQARIVGWN